MTHTEGIKDTGTTLLATVATAFTAHLLSWGLHPRPWGGKGGMATGSITRTRPIAFVEASEVQRFQNLRGSTDFHGKATVGEICGSLTHSPPQRRHSTALLSSLSLGSSRMDSTVMQDESFHGGHRQTHVELFRPCLLDASGKLRISGSLGNHGLHLAIYFAERGM
jgi:hypothetical protein